jgi:hypothetical protein
MPVYVALGIREGWRLAWILLLLLDRWSHYLLRKVAKGFLPGIVEVLPQLLRGALGRVARVALLGHRGQLGRQLLDWLMGRQLVDQH